MKILYCYEFDFLDQHRQSGRPWQLRQSLLERGHEVVDLPNVLDTRPDLDLLKQAAWRLAGRIQRRDRDPARLRRAARRVEEAFATTCCDVVVAPSTIPVAYADPSLRTFLVLDAFFAYNMGRYDSFSRLTSKYQRDGLACDELAMEKCSGIVAPTEALAQAMAATGLIAVDRVVACPWGPNLRPSIPITDQLLDQRFRAKRILFVGREWQRKGLDVVFDAMRTPTGREMRCVVLGMKAKDLPPHLLKGVADRVEFLGELSLASPTERRSATTAFEEASLLMVPTRAENFGITFVEALSFGLPIVTFASDGLASSLGGLNCAALLPAGSDSSRFAEAAAEMLVERDSYVRLCREAERASGRFAWSNVAKALERLFTV